MSGSPTKPLSVALLQQCAPVLVRWKGEETEHFLSRVTHLNLQNRSLTTLSGIQNTPHLKVLYAFDNHISEIPTCISALKDLNLLMLDDNDIMHITNLQECTKLQKLYLNKNQLSCVDGLEHCTHLRELQVAYQRQRHDKSDEKSHNDHNSALMSVKRVDKPEEAACGEDGYTQIPALSFSLSTLTALTQLEYIDISGNGISDVWCFARLSALKVFIAKDNRIAADGVPAVVAAVGKWRGLQRLDIRGNPCVSDVTADEMCRDAIIRASGAAFEEYGGRKLGGMQIACIRRMRGRAAPSHAANTITTPTITSATTGITPIDAFGISESMFSEESFASALFPSAPTSFQDSPAALRMVSGLGLTTPASTATRTNDISAPGTYDILVTTDNGVYGEAAGDTAAGADAFGVVEEDGSQTATATAATITSYTTHATHISPYARPVQSFSAKDVPAIHYDPRLDTAALATRAAAMGGGWDHSSSPYTSKHHISPASYHETPESPHTSASQSSPVTNRRVAIGTASGFRSRHAGVTQATPAPTPLRTPSDFSRASRFARSGYAASENKRSPQSRNAGAKEFMLT